MDITGSYTIPAKQSAVWSALNDPNILKECIPGCETLSMLSETEFAATIVAKIGPLKARFTGRVELSEIDPNNAYRIQEVSQALPRAVRVFISREQGIAPC